MSESTKTPASGPRSKKTSSDRRAPPEARQQRALGRPAFPNDFKPRHHAADLQQRYADVPNEELEPQAITVVGRRPHDAQARDGQGQLRDAAGRLVRQDRWPHPAAIATRDAVGDDAYAAFKHWDLGDIIGCRGHADAAPRPASCRCKVDVACAC